MTRAASSASEHLRSIARRVMRERDLLPDFTAEAQAQADALREAEVAPDPTVRDLRDLLWASIDNDDSLDLDQLSVAAALPDGAVQIRVAIAEVDAAVPLGSPIDVHAAHNTTSVYTAAQVFPMLPTRLSTNLTSLSQDHDRLAIVVDMAIDAAGRMQESTLYRARVRNRAKLAYNSVAAWLDGTGPMPTAVGEVAGMDEQLRLQDRAAALLKRVRHGHGALSLATREARPVFAAGILQTLAADEVNRARELIEDFMIAANTATARFLEALRIPALRRVLRVPAHWERIVAVAAASGTQLPAVPDAAALNAFLVERRRQSPDTFEDLSLTIVKLLGRGEYVMERPGSPDPGHFGLAISEYTHSTAPNRRYPDLVTQRLVKAGLAGAAPPYRERDLVALASHCTAQEDNAAKVERQLAKSAAALLLAPRIGERFAGIVTGASPKGVWVRISAPMTEGRVVRGADGLEVGDHVPVQLVQTDVERGFIDFVRAD